MLDKINLVVIALLLAAAQGMFLTIFILHKHGRIIQNRFLAGLLFLYSFVLVYLMLGDLDVFINHPYLIDYILGFVFLAPPLHLYYAIFQLNPGRKLKLLDVIHLIPFAAFEISRLIQNLSGKPEDVEWFQHQGGPALYNWVILFYSMAYLAVTIYILFRHAKSSPNYLSNIERIRFGWLRNLTYLTGAMLLLFFTENFLFLQGIEISHEFSFSSFMVAVYVYTIGYLSLLKPEIFSVPEAEIIRLGKMEEPAKTTKTEQGAESTGAKYKKSGLSADRASEISARLVELMEKEKPYTDFNLTLNSLADKLKVSPHNLSEVINSRLNQNFFDFVNRYRIDHVKRDLSNPSKKHFTVIALAFEAGFRSKSSFNLLFRKFESITPSEYRKQNLPAD